MISTKNAAVKRLMFGAKTFFVTACFLFLQASGATTPNNHLCQAYLDGSASGKSELALAIHNRLQSETAIERKALDEVQRELTGLGKKNHASSGATPHAVTAFGAFGTGKTTLLRQLSAKLKNQGAVVLEANFQEGFSELELLERLKLQFKAEIERLRAFPSSRIGIAPSQLRRLGQSLRLVRRPPSLEEISAVPSLPEFLEKAAEFSKHFRFEIYLLADEVNEIAISDETLHKLLLSDATIDKALFYAGEETALARYRAQAKRLVRGNIVEYSLAPLAETEISQYLSKIFAGTGRHFSEDGLRALIKNAEGNFRKLREILSLIDYEKTADEIGAQDIMGASDKITLKSLDKDALTRSYLSSFPQYGLSFYGPTLNCETVFKWLESKLIDTRKATQFDPIFFKVDLAQGKLDSRRSAGSYWKSYKEALKAALAANGLIVGDGQPAGKERHGKGALESDDFRALAERATALWESKFPGRKLVLMLGVDAGDGSAFADIPSDVQAAMRALIQEYNVGFRLRYVFAGRRNHVIAEMIGSPLDNVFHKRALRD